MVIGLTAAAIVIALIIFFCMIYRVADIDKALIVTGGKKPIVKVSGGSFVMPIMKRILAIAKGVKRASSMMYA